MCFDHPGLEKLKSMQHFYFQSVHVLIFGKNNKNNIKNKAINTCSFVWLKKKTETVGNGKWKLFLSPGIRGLVKYYFHAVEMWGPVHSDSSTLLPSSQPGARLGRSQSLPQVAPVSPVSPSFSLPLLSSNMKAPGSSPADPVPITSLK